MKINARNMMALVGLCCAGYATTPASRIERNPSLFASFPQEVQNRIRGGRIDIGFTPPMVEMALGAPSRRMARETSEGTADVWLYVRLESRPQGGVMVPVQTYVRARSGAVYAVPDYVWVDREIWHEHVFLRVEFRGGKVTAIETSDS